MGFSNDELELAFSLHVAGLIVAADDQVTRAEQDFLARAFPAELLEASGFLTEAGTRTDRYHEAAMEALDALPSALDAAAKLALLMVLVEAVKADGDVGLDEARALVDGGRLLELDDETIDALLSQELDLDLDALTEG